MNVTHKDYLLIDKAVNYVLTHHVKGMSADRETHMRKFSAEGREKIRKSSSRISYNEVVGIAEALNAYADMLYNNPLYTDTSNIEHAYQLSDKLYDNAAYLLDSSQYK